MKHLLLPILILISLNVNAQKSGFNFDNGIAASIKYLNDDSRNGSNGVKAEMGYLYQLTIGSRLRGRVGVGASVILNRSKTKYENRINPLEPIRFDRDTFFDLRTGSLNTNFMAIAVPLEYRFVSDGRIPWSIGIAYQPGIILLTSGKNEYTQHDLLSPTRQRLNETARITEKTSLKPFTEAVSLNLGYETDRHSLRLTVGRDRWKNGDGFIVKEFHWMFGFEIVKWIHK